jgi:hypothetical protein
MRELTRVVQSRGAREHGVEPALEIVLSQPALADQPPQVELLDQLRERRCGDNVPRAALALLYVLRERLDRRVSQSLVLGDVPDHGG